MLPVNLLPWRLQRNRYRRQRLFILLSSTLLLTCLILFYLAHSHHEKNQQIEKQITQLKQATADLKKRIDVVLQAQQHLQLITTAFFDVEQMGHSVEQTLMLFSHIEQALSNDVWLMEVSIHQRRLTILGKGMSYSAIIAFSLQMSRFTLIDNGILSHVVASGQATNDDEAFHFIFTADWLGSHFHGD